MVVRKQAGRSRQGNGVAAAVAEGGVSAHSRRQWQAVKMFGKAGEEGSVQ